MSTISFRYTLIFALLQLCSVSPALAKSSQEIAQAHTFILISQSLPLATESQSNKQLQEENKQLQDKLRSFENDLRQYKGEMDEHKKDSEKLKFESIKEYNNNLLNTVFFSLLGTVATIALAFIGIKYFAEELQKENQIQKVKVLVEDELIDLINSRLFDLKRRIVWTEYQISILSSDNLDDKCSSYLVKILGLHEKLRAARSASMLAVCEPSQVSEQCILYSLDSMLDSLKIIPELASSRNNVNSTANDHLIKVEKEQADILVNEFKHFFTVQSLSKNTDITNKILDISGKLDVLQNRA